MERAVSVALVPLVTSQLAFGASPITDTLLGVLLPIHLHIGNYIYQHKITHKMILTALL